MRKSYFVAILCFLLVGFFFGGYKLAQINGGGSFPSYNDKTRQFVHEKSTSETLSLIERKNPGIYYFGFPSCPWCQELLPLFNEELKKKELHAYVTNVRASNYTSKDNIRLEKLFIKNTNQPRLSVPFIIEITRKHKIITHVGTVKGHNAELSKMDSKQKNLLKKQLNSMFLKY
ncbi:transporter [Oenococcus sp. UCMA 14587]|nr:transporter [Oenococcus sp. UCMA 14587]